MKKEQILEKINEYKDLYPFAEIVPVSALKKDNVSHLLKVIKSYLPDSVKYYEDGQVTNKPIEFVMAEMVREKVFRFTEQEVPHSITCVVDSVEVGKTSYHVHVSIIVDRDSLKKIIIGSRGSMLKKIGTYARKDLENLLGKKVYLETYVKTLKNWRDEEKYFLELGLKDEDE